MNKILIRKAVEEDAESIVDVITRTWMTTYRGLMPDELLAKHLATKSERVAKISKTIRDGGGVIIAEVNGEIAGAVRYGESRNKEYSDCGEIYALYVADEYQKMGLGKKLFMSAFAELLKQKFNSAIINVLDGNPTINFYKKYGGVEVGIRHDEFYGTVVTERIMFFENINKALKS